MNNTTRRILRLPEVERRTGYKRPSIYRLEAEGQFPARIKLGQGQGGAVGWREDLVNDWAEARERGETWNPPEAA